MNWRQLRSEIEAHIEEKALDLIDQGVPRDEAWARARREFGNATLVIESSREVWVWTWLERLWQDLIYARRIFAKHAGFAAIAVLSIAMGVGANCAMFSLADALLLRPLPVPRPGEVLTLGSTSRSGQARSLNMSYPDYRDLRERNRSFAELTAYGLARVRFATGPDAPLELRTALAVTDNFFVAMGIQPRPGRAFRPGEHEVSGRDAVLALSHAFWQTQFGADPAVLGRAVRLDGIDFTVVGVLPEEFTGADQWIRPDFYLPIAMLPRLAGGGQNRVENRGMRTFDVKGRLRPEATIEGARAEAAVIAEALWAEYPGTNRDYTIQIRTEFQQRAAEAGPISTLVAMMMLVAGIVLAVACANVAGLLASRAPARAREMSVRLAIGAGRARLVRQLLTESAVLALLGGIGGVGLGYAGVQVLKQITIVADVPVALSFRLDERALLFSLAAALLCVFLFGLAPALRTVRTDLASALRAGASAASSSGRPRLWARQAQVAGQIALSMVVLTVAAVMYLTFQRELLAGPGFRADRVLLASFDPGLANYSDAQIQSFYANLTERAKTLPGALSAALAFGVPGTYDLQSVAFIPENYDLPEGRQAVQILSARVDENYFSTLRIPIVSGRDFAATDDAGSLPVAIVNQAAAQLYWPGQDPVGKRLNSGNGGWREIVGVAKNGKYQFLVERPTSFLYLPYRQLPRSAMTLALESAVDPSSLAGPLRELVRGIDPALPVYGIRTLQETWGAKAVQPSRLIIVLAGAMGGMGVLLALTGLYGLMAYNLSARRREIGIRMAIGADKARVLRMLLREGLVLVGAGAGVGALLSVATGRLMAAAFPNHQPTVLSFLMVVPAVFAVTFLAAFLPARRASQANPVAALRQD